VIAHIGPLPVEETVGAFGPLLLAVIGGGVAVLRGHLRRWR
jgi:hypothetical protein